jgi:hypothetical protein
VQPVWPVYTSELLGTHALAHIHTEAHILTYTPTHTVYIHTEGHTQTHALAHIHIGAYKLTYTHVHTQAAIAAGAIPLATWSKRAGGGLDITHK